MICSESHLGDLKIHERNAVTSLTHFAKIIGTYAYNTMTSSNGNIFRVTGPLCGEFTGPGEFPTQRPVARSFDVFFDLRLNKRLSKQSWGWWLRRPLWRHRNELLCLDGMGISIDIFRNIGNIIIKKITACIQNLKLWHSQCMISRCRKFVHIDITNIHICIFIYT